MNNHVRCYAENPVWRVFVYVGDDSAVFGLSLERPVFQLGLDCTESDLEKPVWNGMRNIPLEQARSFVAPHPVLALQFEAFIARDEALT